MKKEKIRSEEITYYKETQKQWMKNTNKHDEMWATKKQKHVRKKTEETHREATQE